ncbi:MAG: TRAP transporter TatT component family protein [Acidiferrobacterales bacterium]
MISRYGSASVHWEGQTTPTLAMALMLIALVFATTTGCSVRKYAAKQMGNVLAESGTVYASDNDIELVGEALPFGLKTMESVLSEVPDHRGLLVATASGFAQYAYVYVDSVAFELEETNPRRARELRKRAKRLYLRGRDYALRALDLQQPDFKAMLRQDVQSALAAFKPENVPELYWAAVAWSAAIATDKQDMELLADLDLIEPMIQRSLELDESFDYGAIHQFMVSFEGGRSAAQGGSVERAREHFVRAMELAEGKKVGPLVSLAETVSVSMQNRKEFQQLLKQALVFDVDSVPEYRLANLIAQRRARVLLSRIDDFFIGD